MPPSGDRESIQPRSLDQLVSELDRYPLEAFQFVQQGLSYTVQKIHGHKRDPRASRHVTGQQLCHGLREYALLRWGLLARTVLRRWNIHATLDFGRIVFAMVENGLMQKTEQDTLDDFRDVYDFRTAFESSYRIPPDPAQKQTSEGRTT